MPSENARRVLDVDEFTAVVNAAGEAAGSDRITSQTLVDVVAAALAKVDVLTPAPEPNMDACTALFPGDEGSWVQCIEDPGHDNDGPCHDSGDWAWNDAHPDAIPPRHRGICGRCRESFDPNDTRFDGKAQFGNRPFCRRCVDRCHESNDAGHRCAVCE